MDRSSQHQRFRIASETSFFASRDLRACASRAGERERGVQISVPFWGGAKHHLRRPPSTDNFFRGPFVETLLSWEPSHKEGKSEKWSGESAEISGPQKGPAERGPRQKSSTSVKNIFQHFLRRANIVKKYQSCWWAPRLLRSGGVLVEVFFLKTVV